MNKNILAAFALVLLATQFPVRAGFLSSLQSMVTTTNSTASASPTAASLAGLTQDQMVGGLKDALSQGVQKAVAALGHPGGFETNPAVKIPIPAKLQMVQKALQMAGQNKMVDDFIGSLNKAAETAIPVTGPVFGDAVKQMSVTDAQSIITGPDNSATEYFRRTTETNLYMKCYPLVQQATAKVGVTAQYKDMIAKFQAANSLTSLFGKPSVNFQASDIDGYVTQKALDSLFQMVGSEEKSIRTSAAARSTDLLQKVFGATAH